MAWSHLDITKPHLVYIILGGFTSLFMLCSSFIKERMYIGEATVATLCGVIFGPHAANLINPQEWGSTDIVTVEFSRIVLVVQCFAVGVELPKFYMERHWKSVVFLLVPVMTFGWLIVSLFIFWMIPALDWLDSLVVAACVTATDPVLASSVVGKGKFAKRVPKHLRDLLSAESGCNDGMAFPFIYLSLYLIQYKRDAQDVSFHFVVYVLLYECIFGAIYGFTIGYIARHGIKFAEKRDLIDRESFLVFYFVVALWCAGSGSILGMDDLLVGFAAGVGFSNDGWFGEKTEESHVSNVIDLLLNLTYFVYFGTIIPWSQFNDGRFGMMAWRLVVIAVFVLFFRRIPIMLALKPFIPDVKTWREALFAGHFGPIGVGAIFVAILARAELEHGEPVPLAEMPPENTDHYELIYLVWPIVCFMVVTSILVHGSSIAVFTLGKRINTLSLTMSYTAAPEDGPSWMNRLPRISSQSRSQARSISEASIDEEKGPQLPPDALVPPNGPYSHLLRRQRDQGGSRSSSVVSRKRKHKNWDDNGPGGPIAQSAIFPQRQSSTPLSPTEQYEQEESPSQGNTESTLAADDSSKEKDTDKIEKAEDSPAGSSGQKTPPKPVDVYEEGHDMIFENKDGDVLDVEPAPESHRHDEDHVPITAVKPGHDKLWTISGFKKRVGEVYNTEMEKRKEKGQDRRHEPARAYQFGNTIIVEDEDGEVVKTYELPTTKGENSEAGPSTTPGEKTAAKPGWTNFGGVFGGNSSNEQTRKKSIAENQAADDKAIRFTIGGVGQRMTKEDFIREVQKLDSRTRREVVEQSSASQAVKKVAKQDLPPETAIKVAKAAEHHSSGKAKAPEAPAASPSRHTGPSSPSKPSEEQGETAVERKRRLAVLSAQGDDEREEETGETPAERRRREAALGVGNGGDDSDDDEGTERVPPGRRGITFADSTRPSRGRAPK
ncbi:CPA1 family monovalent cation:H+ antiporter [Fusarium oxysporum f. sp. melonis 26406]|uniref:CPA1 family monovalent cation:H+ antiporter n=1 Tax=Fusarium oxysporum f. sp. melonis 26406 TaxID=1089452 RepID=W9ZNB9_FUSOX|nr:CPA1 family monovalent cation:H+ antiporter [Fusarium oxysporum f. sp. melonis 26406]